MKAAYYISLAAAALAILAFSAPAPAATMDSRIVSSARKSYVFKTYLQGDDIRIDSKEGAVTLTGFIAASFHKTLAQETLAGLPGVRSVDNRLEVRGSSPTANSDMWLSDKVKITLLFHRSLNSGRTEVEVKDGVVTLRGSAISQEQKELTAEYARDVEGVKDVSNEMAVETAPAAVPRTTSEKIDDVSVAALVRMALLLHHSTSGAYTTVAVRRGVATVGGKARTAAEKDQVSRIVKDVNGVTAVKNLMTIK